MKKSMEIRNQIDAKLKEAENFNNAGDTAKADECIKAIEQLKVALKLAEEQEELEKEKPKDPADPAESEPANKNKTNYSAKQRKEFNALVTGRIEPQNASLNIHSDEDGGYLIPEDQYNEIKEFRRDLNELKNYCTVYQTKTNKGKMPIEVEAKDKLYDFDDDGTAELDEHSIKFGQMSFSCKAMGDIIPISNTLLEDETAKLSSYIGRRFAKKSVRSENADILTALAGAKALTPTTNDYHDIINALNTGIPSGVRKGAVILTNQSGYNYLDNLEDKTGRPLLKELADGTGVVFKGKEIVVVDDDDIVTTGNKLKFYVGNIAEYLAFIDRQGIVVATSEHAGFTRNATLMRAIERYDVKVVDSKAVVALEIDTTRVASEKTVSYEVASE